MRERVLGLVQYWVDAFKDKPQLSAVGELYGQLKDEGVEFPPMDLDTLAPVETQDRVRIQHICYMYMMCNSMPPFIPMPHESIHV